MSDGAQSAAHEPNSLRQKVARGEVCRGVFLHIPSPSLVELAGHMGFDWIFIDTEHGPMGLETVEHMVRAAECSGIVPIVRLPYPDPRLIHPILDTGARGVLVPHMDSPELASAVVEAVRYRPLGKRGAGQRTRAAGFGVKFDHTSYVKYSNEDLLVFGIIEDVSALDVLDDILSVDGLFGLDVGPSDLSHSMGLPGQIEHPEVEAAVQEMSDKILDSNVALNRVIMYSDAERIRVQLSQFLAMGVPLIAIPLLRLLEDTARMYLSYQGEDKEPLPIQSDHF